MRKVGYLIALTGLFGASAVVMGGCVDAVALWYTPLTDPKLLDGGSDGGGGTGGADGGGGTGGSGGSTPAGCIPSENVDAVGDTCGVFVSNSLGLATGAKGTKEAPFKTITAALAEAQKQGKPVYACGESFAESVSISADAKLYGGLDCAAGWVYTAAKKTTIAAPADTIAMVISNASTSAELLDFAITSANATQDGGSSIALLVAQASASFTRTDITAGDGKAGAPGAPFTSAAQVGVDGLVGANACAAAASLGGLSVTNVCGDGDSISGSGGIGQTNSGGPGGDGGPLGSTNGGKGENPAPKCDDGTTGDSGGPGDPALGATGIGTIAASGYTGVSGGQGTSGHVAQGGGGGGGSKGETTASVCPMGKGGGASGGSGGSGGCGGLGGKGGSFGGASLALVSLDASLSFTSVTLKAGSGGNGGDGGDGQSGGDGGMPGPGGMGSGALKQGCAGGPGGKGGQGGKGGGGTGGHSLAIAMTGKAVPMMGLTTVKGMPGEGGKGDTANGNMGDGAKGIAAECWDFVSNAACK